MAMECELVRLAGVPMGLVTSALFYTTTNKPGSRQADFEGPSEQAREVQIAICPTGRLMAFIASYKAQFVASNDSLYVRGSGDDGNISSYQTTYEGLLKVVRHPNTPRPVATAVIIVPVTLETRTDTSSIILVGFTDGCIRAYSKMGVTLFSQSLHGEPVVAIHCMAPSGGSGGPSKINVSVLVVFPSLVCVVEGWSVCEAVGHAVGARDRWEAEEEEVEEVPVISYRKWRLGDQRGTTDAALLAPSIPCLYDYLCEAGNVGGYDIMIRGGPSPQSQLIVIGESPMIALYRISKDSGTVNVSEVVSAVASKMTRSVLGKLSQAGGWLGWGGGGGTTPPSKLKPQEKKMVMNLPMSTNIPDERRTVTSISVSPLGNLSVCVDGFGRILLLDNHAMTIRRMWKGYRDAQTGWVLVHDTTPSSQSSTSHHHKKRRKTSEKLPSSSSSSSSENQKRAQCLCVYLPRRGLVELWPVQNGSRIAVFQVGKGCRLLSAPHGILTASKPGDVSAAMTGRVCGLQHTALLLCPNGQLLSFIIPFPTLVRLNDSSSYDAHLLQKLSPTLQEGDESGLLQIIASLKTVQSLKEAVEGVMYAYPITSLPRQSPALIVEKALKRTNRTDASHQVLCTYLRGVRQLFRLYVYLSQIGSVKSATTPSSAPSNLPQLLTDMCGLAGDAVVEVTKSLEQYASCKPAKLHTHVVRTLSLKELMKCFDLAMKMGRGELTGEEGKEKDVREGERDVSSETMGQDEIVPLSLKKNTNESTLFDLSFALFHGILTQDVAEKTLHTILVNCGISFSTLLTMLCRVFLSGRVTMTSDPAHLLHRLYMIVHVIVPDSTRDGEEIEGAMADIRRQCSHTHNVGHALIMVLICHRLVSARNTDIEHVSDIDNEEWGEGDWGSDGGGVSGWDTVTEEGEQWVRLQHRLEVLTQLCGTVGLTVMSKTPPLPYMIQPRDTLTVKLMNDDVSSEGISMMLLETVGPWLIAHCIAYWLVTNKPLSPPKTITATMLQADHHPSSVQDIEHADILNGLVPLVKLFQYTLSSSSLLVHCAWQAAYLWTKEPSKHQELNEYILQCISLIPESRILAGVCLFLWHSLFEPKFVESLGHLKKGTQQSPGSHECVSLSRHLFGYLHQLGDGIRNKGEEGGGKDGETRLCDVISIPLPSGVEFMMDVIPSLPIPSSSLIQTYLSLLLHTELALLLSSTHNVISFYPSWVRMVIKKGLLSRQDGKDDGSRQHTPVATQLQQKRVKFLCEAITHFLDSSSPKLRPSIPSIAIHHHSQPSPTTQSGSRLEVTEFTSALFLLAELWCIDVDVVRRHYVTCLFAAGLGERGKEALQSVKDKSRAALDLLSLAGCLTDILLQQIGSKPERLALTAQLPPTQLEWIRKQTASGVLESCPRVSPTWSSLSLLLTLIQPHLPPPSTTSPPSTQQSSTSTAATIAYSLAKISSLQTS